MANFPTHIAVGTLASGMLATLTLAANVVGPESLIAVTTAGVVGSILPDIDLKDSRPGRALFFGLAAFFSFVTLFLGAGKLSISELWILAGGTFLFVQTVVHAIFHRISYHRGIFHSILAAAFFACLTAAAYRHLLGRHEGVAWLAGGFMFVGYIVHLALDEIYSVDVMDTRIKSSFGTALKFWDGRHLGHSTAMAICTVLAFLITPPTKPFVEGITSPALWAGLKQQLLPRHKWFGYFGNVASTAHMRPTSKPLAEGGASEPAVPGSTSADVTTGSIAKPPTAPTARTR